MKTGVEQGYMTLLAVLITGAVALAVATTLLTSGVTNSQIMTTYNAGIIARSYARTCAEIAMYEIHENSLFTGSGSDAGCTYTVTSLGVNSYRIDAVGTSGDATKALTIFATISGANMVVSSWRETP
jgi:hypothetical protein